jgi:ATP-dependent RNA helicase DDX51/DBP6
VIHKPNVKNKIKVLGDSGTLGDARTRSSEEERAPDSKEEISDVESFDAGESENPITSITAVQRLSVHSATTSHVEVERPRKRRKLEKGQNATANPVLDAASTASRGSSQNEETPLVDGFLLGPRAADLVPLAAFPMPSAPVAASQKALALQGLDPRLIDAEIVDSTRTMPIDSPDTDDVSSFGLGSKTRKRLKELGITKLFAGKIFFNQSMS